MNYRIIAILYLIGLISLGFSQQDQGTTLTFYIQQENEQEEDFVEITLQVKNQDGSLVSALAGADKIIEQVQNVVTKYCQDNQGDADCQEAVDKGNFDIQAKYQLIRKTPTFQAFIVTYQVTVKVTNTEKIGDLVDKILGSGVTQISSLQWLPEEEKDGSLDAFASGVQQGKKLCKSIGEKFGKVLTVEEVREEEEQPAPAEEEEQQQEQQEQEQEPTVYKFEVECIPKSSKK